MKRVAAYVGLNLIVALLVAVGFSMHSDVAHPLYVILLFAICTSPILEITAINGPYSLLALWSLDYFIMYGALDLQHLLLGADEAVPLTNGVLDSAELLILVCGVVVQVTYRTACKMMLTREPAQPPRDWPEWILVVFGLVLWVVSTKLCWDFSVYVLPGRSNAATTASLQNLGGVKVGLFMIARTAQPVSILILAYAQCRYRRAYMLPLILGIVLFQLVFGFIIDFKEQALIGGVLVELTSLMVSGRIPKGWLALTLVVIAVGFPVLQANRVVRDEREQNSTAASQSFLESLNRAFNAQKRVSAGKERAQTALERLTTKTSVETIVTGTDAGVPFQHGYTLLPMITTFIPRLLWPGKPSIPTGQIMNKEFHVSAVAETYISPSHMGELYWNFGWPGALVGMALIGGLFGFLGGKFDLSRAATLTRLLVILVTVREAILSSEGELATHYVVWMRSLAGVGLLHLAFAHRVWAGAGDAKASSQPPPPTASENLGPFPNLLR